MTATATRVPSDADAVPSRPRTRRGVMNAALRARLALLAFLAVLGYLVLVPLLRMQIEALADGGEGYRQAFGVDSIGRTIGYTVALAIGSTVIAVGLGTYLAWATRRLPRPLRFLRIFPVLPIVMPAVANVVAWAFLLSPRPGYLNAMLRTLPWWSDLSEGPADVYTLPWIILITGLSLSAFVYLFVSAGFGNISGEAIEAAQVSGDPPWRTFFTITLPLLRPTLVYGTGVAFLLALGQFTAPLLLGANGGVSVITTDMYYRLTQSPVQFAAASALGSPLLVVGVLLIIGQKRILGDQARFVTHGGKAFRSQERPSWVAAFTVMAYGILFSIVPLLALIAVSLSNYWSGSLDFGAMNIRNYIRVFQETDVPESIWNSLLFSLVAVAITIPIGFIAASILIRGRRYPILRAILDLIISIPLGIPAVVFGAGFLFAYTSGPVILYGTPWVVILVYVTLMIPFGTRMLLAGMLALGESYLEASRVCGAGAVKTYVRIMVPLMRTSIGGAAALMFVLLTHEFSASVLVRASRTQVMGTILFDYWSDGSYPLVAAIAVIMTVVTTFGVAVALLIGGKDSLESM